MKKLLLIAVIALGLGAAANAQEVGIRFGNFGDNNVAIDGILGISGHRIHADVSFGDGVGIDALWDFVNNPLGNAEGLNWYAGVGPSLFLGDDDFFLGVSGEIGLEYHFTGAPIALGIDWRPNLQIVDDTHFYADRFGLNVRFCF